MKGGNWGKGEKKEVKDKSDSQHKIAGREGKKIHSLSL